MQPLDAQTVLARWSPRLDQQLGAPLLGAVGGGALALALWGLAESDSIRRATEWCALALLPVWLAWTWRRAHRPIHVISVAELELETSPYGATPTTRDYYVKFVVRSAAVGNRRRASEVVDLQRFPRAAQLDAASYGALISERRCAVVLDHALRPIGIELADGRRFQL